METRKTDPKRLRTINALIKDVLASGAPFDIQDVTSSVAQALQPLCTQGEVRGALNGLAKRGIVRIQGQCSPAVARCATAGCSHTAVWLVKGAA